MEKDKVIRVEVKNLLAICYMLYDFKEFNKRCTELLNGENSNLILKKLIKVSNNEFCFKAGKERKFYKKNKKCIDIIKKYSNLESFLKNYDRLLNTYRESLSYMYEYIVKNRSELDKIIAVLEKLIQLKIRIIDFDENFDFTICECYVWNSIRDNRFFVYADNLKYIPSDNCEKVYYRTEHSNYMIECKNRYVSNHGFNNFIMLNTLIFDEKTLPETIESNAIFNELLKLKDTSKGECSPLKNLETIALKMNDVIDKIDSVGTKEELSLILKSIKEIINKIQDDDIELKKQEISDSIDNIPRDNKTEEKIRIKKQ